jgi:NAD(P)-dependent dehydrogenase (short-subunit alcohol dehydrogenase family)
VDVADPVAVQGLVEEVRSRWGRLDVLVNNAGIADYSRFDAFGAVDLERVLAVNLSSALICTRAAATLLERSASARVLNLSSVLGYRVVPECIPYCTSKGAIITLTKCLAVELAPRGIRVNAIAPGTFDTRMARLPDGSHEYEAQDFKEFYIRGGRLPLGRIGRLEELGAAAYFFCSDDSSYVTGQTLLVDGGMSVRL